MDTADDICGFNTLVCLRGLLLPIHCDQPEGTVTLCISGKVFRFASLQADKYDLNIRKKQKRFLK